MILCCSALNFVQSARVLIQPNDEVNAMQTNDESYQIICRSCSADDEYFSHIGYDAVYIGIRLRLEAESCPSLWNNSVKTEVANSNPPLRNVGILYHLKEYHIQQGGLG
jgi:hypothetical protein